MKILNLIIWGVNWFGLIVCFILGYLLKKYDDKTKPINTPNN